MARNRRGPLNVRVVEQGTKKLKELKEEQWANIHQMIYDTENNTFNNNVVKSDIVYKTNTGHFIFFGCKIIFVYNCEYTLKAIGKTEVEVIPEGSTIEIKI